MKKVTIELTRIEICELPGTMGANVKEKTNINSEDSEIEQTTFEFSRKELKKVLKDIRAKIVEETKILSRVAEKPESGLYDCFLASINRKTELYDKLHKVLNNRYLDLIYSNGNL